MAAVTPVNLGLCGQCRVITSLADCGFVDGQNDQADIKMKLLYTRILFLLLAVTASLTVLADGRWTLEKQDDELGIQVFTREVDGSDLKAFRGTMTLKSTLTAPVALIEDTRRAPEWMYNCKVVEIIEFLSPGEALSYMVTEAPWPVSDRDTIVHSLASQDKDSKVVRIDVHARTDVFPENDEYVRITQMQGFWSFAPAARAGMIDVIYEVHAEPNGGLPSWLANSVVVETPYHTLKNMQRLLQESQYQQAELAFIDNVD